MVRGRTHVDPHSEIADGGATGSRLPGGTSVGDLPTSSLSVYPGRFTRGVAACWLSKPRQGRGCADKGGRAAGGCRRAEACLGRRRRGRGAPDALLYVYGDLP
eukprot:scaffold3392_cov50-Phaeocystis_antarctica.AAC.2